MKITNILLAFQLENYRNLRFLKFIYTHPSFWIFGSKRQTLVWTKKAQLIFILTQLLILLDILGVMYFLSGTFWMYICFIGILCFLPLYYVIANILLLPLDTYLKNRIIAKAKQKLASLPQLTVIGITGSYGKTSTKEILATILKQKLVVVAPEGTKNTPLGTSELILQKLNEKTQVLIVEMGAYTKGDIKQLCNLVHPDISILTGITQQHLERFGSVENIIDAKFEIFEGLTKDDTAIIDISSQGAQKGLEQKKSSLQVQNWKLIDNTQDFTYLPDFTGIQCTIEGHTYTTKLIAKHIVNTLKICIFIAKKLGLTDEEIQKGIENLDYVEHRMQVIRNTANNTVIIDDSFNGNIQGVASIIDVLKNTPHTRRKVAILGGIVELGDELEKINMQLGKDFAGVADLILLSKGPVGEAIEKGIFSTNYKKEQVKMYGHTLDLHKDLANMIQQGDVVIFQNDLTDNYL